MKTEKEYCAAVNVLLNDCWKEHGEIAVFGILEVNRRLFACTSDVITMNAYADRAKKGEGE